MSKNYRAKVSFDLTGASRREYRHILELVSDALYRRADTAGALLLGAERDRRIDLVMQVESGSRSTADSKVDTVIRRLCYAIDPNAGVRTRHRGASLSQDHVTKELVAS